MDRREKENLQAVLSEQMPPHVHVRVVAAEPDGKCELCGASEETRPYGPDGKEICWSCGQIDRAATMQRMAKVRFGDDITREEAEEIAAKAERKRKELFGK